MPTDVRSEETQLKMLRLLIAETQGNSARFTKELETFAEAFAQTCGHNRLEQIGLRWSTVVSPEHTYILVHSPRAANAFAAHLHRALMLHLLPDEAELETLTKAHIMQWTTALRMGIQGVLRRRAIAAGDPSGRTDYALPNEDFLETLQPVIQQAAEEFFATHEEVQALPGRRTARV